MKKYVGLELKVITFRLDLDVIRTSGDTEKFDLDWAKGNASSKLWEEEN